VKRNPTIFVFLGTGDFRAGQSAATTQFDSFRAHFHRGGNRLFHGAPEANASFELARDGLSH
jgi:hypothetical protein